MKYQVVNEILAAISRGWLTLMGLFIVLENEILNCLNYHFGTVGSKMAEACNNIDSKYIKDPISLIKRESNPNSMILYPTNEQEMFKLISNLNNKKSCGYDLLSNNILKASKDVILPYITFLINICINKNTFPSAYKVAKVIPLFKGGDKENPNCYRPISLLPTLGKLFEKLLRQPT